MRALKLNLGCGSDKRRGYINVDVDPRLKPDVVHDLLKPLPFEDNSTSEIVLQDVLEHFTREQAEKLLKGCARVLKKNGKLLLRVPNVEAIYKKYKSQPDLLMLFLYGDTSVSGTWGAHKYGYTRLLMEEMVEDLGLSIVSARETDTNFEFALVKKLRTRPTVICAGLLSYMFQTLLGKIQRKRIIWHMSRTYPNFLAKSMLRPLSKVVDKIVVPNKQLADWVKVALHYSHLRLVVK